MTPRIADNDLGACAGCGVGIDAGEWYMPRSEGATHATCTPRPRTMSQPVPESSMLLFADLEREVIESAKESIDAADIRFDGVSARPVDVARLAGQLQKVFELMRDGRFRTLSAIAESVGCLETSASARLRDFRKARNGGHEVAMRFIGDGINEYRLILRSTKEFENGERAALAAGWTNRESLLGADLGPVVDAAGTASAHGRFGCEHQRADQASSQA